MKRAQAAGTEGSTPSGDRPWVPTPMPDSGLARRWMLRRAAGGALLVLAGAAAAYWFWVRAPSGSSVSRTRIATRSLAATPAPAVFAPPTAFPVSIVPTPPRAGQSVVSPAKTPEQAIAAGTAQPPPAAQAPVARRPGFVSGKTYSGVVTLPEGAQIELGGIVWSETEPRALINDRVVGVGAYVEGFIVSRIETDRVELQKDGATIVLAVK